MTKNEVLKKVSELSGATQKQVDAVLSALSDVETSLSSLVACSSQLIAENYLLSKVYEITANSLSKNEKYETD